MPKRDLSDDILYCDRCGISFLWSREEQVQGRDSGSISLQPTHCPGCRQLLPHGERQRGLVKWFNHRKRFGFLVRAHDTDLFVHRSALARNIRLHPGDLVEFSVKIGERGPAADAVMVLSRQSNLHEGKDG